MIDIDRLVEVQEGVRRVVPGASVSILPSDAGGVRLTAVSGEEYSSWGTSPVLLESSPHVAVRELSTRLAQRLAAAAKRAGVA